MHISREILEAFERGAIPARELLDLMREHLLELCPECRDEARVFAGQKHFHRFLTILPALQARWRLARQAEEREQVLAQKWMDELRRLPAAEQLGRVERARTRFRGVAVARLMLDQARASTPMDPDGEQRWAQMAERACVQRLDEAPEILALAAAHQANAYRLRNRDDQALAFFDIAHHLLGFVTDLPTIAEILSLQGSLFMDQRRFDQADACFRRVLRLHQIVPDEVQQGRTLVQLGNNHYFAGQFTAAMEATQAALRHLSEADGYPYICARHNQVLYLDAAGHHVEAMEHYRQLLPLLARQKEARLQLAGSWLAGKIAGGLGRDVEAEQWLLQTRQEFLARGDGYDAALVALDLMALWERQQRVGELQQLVAETLPVLRGYKLDHEASQAIEVLQRVLGRGRVSMALLRGLALQLHHARRRLRR